MFHIETNSPMFAVSVPDKKFKSFIRAVYAMHRAIMHRAYEYGYGLKETISYELDETHFVVEFVDDFGITHSYSVVEDE